MKLLDSMITVENAVKRYGKRDGIVCWEIFNYLKDNKNELGIEDILLRDKDELDSFYNIKFLDGQYINEIQVKDKLGTEIFKMKNKGWTKNRINKVLDSLYLNDGCSALKKVSHYVVIIGKWVYKMSEQTDWCMYALKGRDEEFEEAKELHNVDEYKMALEAKRLEKEEHLMSKRRLALGTIVVDDFDVKKVMVGDIEYNFDVEKAGVNIIMDGGC